ncbi:MAG: hypothetical protein ACOYT4_00590 [Nanoarchaeota archaeon]
MTLLNIITDAGNTFIDGNMPVYISQGDTYVKITGKYLEKGDVVLYRKEYIKIPLNKVDETLELRAENYREAKKLLFEKNNNGIWIPKLRCLLFRGFDSNEDKILKNNDDFSTEEYLAYSDLTYGLIQKYSSKTNTSCVTWDTILNWLKGNVCAPFNKDYFEALSEINPQFEIISKGFKEGNGEFRNAYEKYMAVRKGLMAYIAKAKQKDSERKLEEKAERKTSHGIDEEKLIILEEFGQDLLSDYFPAYVKDIQHINKAKSGKLNKQRQNTPHLFKGIYTEQEHPPDINAIRIEDIAIKLKERLNGLNWINDKDKWVKTLKEIAIECNFPLKMLKQSILEDLSRRHERLLDPHVQELLLFDAKLMPHQIKEAEIKTAEREFGCKYEKLSFEIRSRLEEEMSRRIKLAKELFLKEIAEKEGNIRALKNILKKELQ